MKKFNKTSKPISKVSKVYRYFKEEVHAEAFLKGKVRISTLNRCRQYENPQQGDKHEGKLIYSSGIASGMSDAPDVREVAKRIGMNISQGAAHHVAMIHCQGTTSLSDAYVFSCSTLFDPDRFKPDFGEFCVTIIDPGFFCKKLSEVINSKTAIYGGSAGNVSYKARHYSGLESPPEGDIGFIKPLEYKDQEEYRFLWTPISRDIDYLDVECRHIRGLLTRVN